MSVPLGNLGLQFIPIFYGHLEEGNLFYHVFPPWSAVPLQAQGNGAHGHGPLKSWVK